MQIQTHLCVTSSPVQISYQTLKDLDIFGLLRVLFPPGKNNDEAITDFLHTYLTAAPGEINRRIQILTHLQQNPQSPALLSNISAANERLYAAIKNLRLDSRPLEFCVQYKHALTAYITALGSLESLFCPTAQNPAISALAASIQAEKNSGFYHMAAQALHHLNTHLPPLNNVTLAVNLSSDGRPVHIGVTNINGGEMPVGIFGPGTANSLTAAAPIKSQSRFSYFADFIFTQVEKQWAPKLKAAMHHLRKVDFDGLILRHQWLSHADLYSKGLHLAARFTQLGYGLCKPTAQDACQAAGMVYPSLALLGKAPKPLSMGIGAGDTVMITGANGSGKTSAVKAFVQNSLLAQLGFLVPAASFAFIPFARWFTVFSAVEDAAQASGYRVETGQMDQVMAAADGASCVILNEPFTSTGHQKAAEDICRAAAGLSQKGATTILITHLYDVYDMLLCRGINVGSYVTKTAVAGGKLIKAFELEARKPDAHSLARFLASEHGFAIANMVNDPAKARALEAFMAEVNHDPV